LGKKEFVLIARNIGAKKKSEKKGEKRRTKGLVRTKKGIKGAGNAYRSLSIGKKKRKKGSMGKI